MLKRVLVISVLLIAASSAFAYSASIYSMIANNYAVDLADVVQITSSADGDVDAAWLSPDGRYLAYIIRVVDKQTSMEEAQLRLMKLDDRQFSTLLDTAPMNVKTGDPTGSKEVWWAGRVSWSPTSSALVFPVRHIIADTSGKTTENSLVVVSTNGAIKASFRLQDDSLVYQDIVWNGNGRLFAAIVEKSSKASHRTSTLCVFDVAADTMRELVTVTDGYLGHCAWSSDGQRIQYTSLPYKHDSTMQLKEIALDDPKSDRVLINDYHDETTSPDGRLKLLGLGSRLTVRNIVTGKNVDLGISSVGGFIGWTPDSKMFTYYTENTISAGDKMRSEKERYIWLACPEAHKLNHMCVATDADADPKPTWSYDCSEMAYTSHHRLYAARLNWRLPKLDEKLVAGMPLSQEEQEALAEEMLSNGKELGNAAQMYSLDYDNNLPSPDTSADDLWPYVGDKDILAFPGVNGKPFQQVLDGSLKDVKDPSQTPMFILDAGYGWRVVVYANGQSKLVSK